MNTPRKPPPPPPGGRPLAEAKPPAADRFSISAGLVKGAERVGLYGTGGIGKTTLLSLAPSPVLLDIGTGSGHMDVPRVGGIDTWQDMMDCLNSDVLDDYATIGIDDLSKAEEMSIAHVISHVPHEKGKSVNCIEDYGWGKGLGHNYDNFLHLFAACDRHIRAGRNVLLVAHDCTASVPNPGGEDYIRYEPHLQAPSSGKNSIRERFIQWCDHLLFIGYDVYSEDGKGRGSGTRTIYTQEMPTHRAKSRTVQGSFPFAGPDDGAIWDLILGGK